MKNAFFTRKGGEYVNHFTKKEIFLFKPTCDSLFWYTFVTWNCCVAKKDSITRPSPTSSVARSDIRIKKHAQGSSWRKKVGANAWLLRATTCRWARKNILKKAFSGLFGFDNVRTSQLLNCSLKTKQREMPLVRCMQIYASLMTVQPQLYPIVSEYHCIYTSRGADPRCSFRRIRAMRRPQQVERATGAGSTFLFLYGIKT